MENNSTVKIIGPSLFLTGIALIAAFLLSHVNKNTSKVINERKIENQRQAVQDVLPGFSNIIEEEANVDGKVFNYWVGTRENSEEEIERAYAILASEPGYSGNIDTMVGFDENFKVLRIVILHQTETPGLGTRCMEVADDTTIANLITGKRKKSATPKKPWFQEQFTGLSMNEPVNLEFRGDWTPRMRDELLQRNSITSITGATITSRVILRSIENKANELKKILSEKSEEENIEENIEDNTEENGGLDI